MPMFFQRERQSLLCKVVVLSALALSGCGEDKTVSNYDNSTNHIFDDAPIGIMTVSSLCGGPVVLDAAGSYDPEGSALSYKWMLVEAPAGSSLGASFTSASTPRVSTLVDTAGSYVFQLMVSDGSKQSVTQTISVSATPPAKGGLDTGNCYSNVAEFPAAIRKGVVNARPGQALTLDAALANDSGATYLWTLVSSPAGSAVSLGGASTSTPGFTPDVAGDYKLSLAVKKSGQAWAAAVVVVRASSLEAIPLSYVVTRSALITGSNKVASISGDNTFRIHDLASGNDYSITLPGNALAFSISPDGSRALVLQKTLLSLINTDTHTLTASWPLGGSSTEVNPSDVVMVNNQQAYVYASDSSNYNRLYPFNADTGTLSSAIPGFNGSSYYSSEAGFQRFSTDAFFFKEGNSSLFKVSLNPDGSVAQVSSVTQPNNCYSASFLSEALMVTCGAVYGVAGSPPVLAFQSYIDLGLQQYYGFPAGNMMLSADGLGLYAFADGLGLYAFKDVNYSMPGDILKFRTDTWTREPSIVLPAVESGTTSVLPATQKILVDANNPLVIIGRSQLPSSQFLIGAYSYYLLRPY